MLNKMKEITYRQAIREALIEEMDRDEKVFIMGEDIAQHGGVFAVTQGLMDRFDSKRVLNTPISELGFTGAGVGASLLGLRPVIEIMYMDFVTLAMDPIVNQAAKIHYTSAGQLKVPLVIRTQKGIGTSTGAQHSQSLESWFMHVPGLKVVAPSTPQDAKGLLKSAIRDDNPVIFIEDRMLYGLRGKVEEEKLIEIGTAQVKRQGSDITLVAYSNTVHITMVVADELKKRGIEAEVIDLRTLLPLDTQTIISSVKKTGRCLIVEGDCECCGVGAEISAQVMEKAFDWLDAPVRRLAAPNTPIPANTYLEKQHVPQAEEIIEVVEELTE